MYKNYFLYFLGVIALLSLALYATKHFSTEEVTEVSTTSTTSESQIPEDASSTESSDISDAEWVLSPPTPQGTQFSYPVSLPMKYVSVTEWPPLVEMTANDYVCEEGEVLAADGPLKTSERKIVGTQEYCRTVFTEGAAGSTYTNYDYTTQQGDFVVRVVFTVKTPQCVNYDEPEQSDCKAEQARFDPDTLADRIAASLRML